MSLLRLNYRGTPSTRLRGQSLGIDTAPPRVSSASQRLFPYILQWERFLQVHANGNRHTRTPYRRCSPLSPPAWGGKNFNGLICGSFPKVDGEALLVEWINRLPPSLIFNSLRCLIAMSRPLRLGKMTPFRSMSRSPLLASVPSYRERPEQTPPPCLELRP